MYNPRYQTRSAMYIRGLIPRNFGEFAEAVPIVLADAISWEISRADLFLSVYGILREYLTERLSTFYKTILMTT